MTRQQRNSPDADERGFTLLELLVGLGILAIVLVVIAPLANRTRAGMELRSTAFDIASSMRNARAAAQTQQCRAGARHRCRAPAGCGPRASRVRKPLPRRFGMTLDLPVAERVSANAGRVRFFPDGSASGGKVVLREGGRVATVFVNWLNGDVQVQWTQ